MTGPTVGHVAVWQRWAGAQVGSRRDEVPLPCSHLGGVHVLHKLGVGDVRQVGVFHIQGVCHIGPSVVVHVHPQGRKGRHGHKHPQVKLVTGQEVRVGNVPLDDPPDGACATNKTGQDKPSMDVGQGQKQREVVPNTGWGRTGKLRDAGRRRKEGDKGAEGGDKEGLILERVRAV